LPDGGACSSRGLGRDPFDLIAKGQQSLPGEREAVVGLELAAGYVDVYLLLEGQELEHGQGVAFATRQTTSRRVAALCERRKRICGGAFSS